MTNTLGWQTLTDMVAEVGVLVHDTNSARYSVIKAIINRAYDAIASEFDWPQFIIVDETGVRRTTSSATVATFESGQAEIPLPYGSASIAAFELQYQDSTKPRIPVVGAAELYEQAGSSLTSQRRPEMAAIIGQTAQTDRLASAAMLIAKSNSSANDSLSLRVEYVPDSASFQEVVTESITGAFTTGVSLSATAKAGWPIRQLVIPSGWKGDVTIEDVSGNVILYATSGVQPTSTGQTPARAISCPLLRLWPVPDKDYAVTITYRRRPRRLVNDDDAVEIPVAGYLVEKAAAEILRQQNKPDLGRQHEYEGERFLRALRRRNLPRPMAARSVSFIQQTGMADS